MFTIPDELLDVIRRIRPPSSRVDVTRAIQTTSASYNRRAETGTVDLDARLQFYLPRDLMKPMFVMHELQHRGMLRRDSEWRILDLGAGLGATLLGTTLFAIQRQLVDRIRAVVLDSDREPLRVLETLATRCFPAVLEVDARVADLRRPLSIDGRFDLILLGLVLNELPDDPSMRAEFLLGLAPYLAPDGSIVVIEPALKTTSRALQVVRDRIEADGRLRVVAPCLRTGPCPMLLGDRDWCHYEKDTPLPTEIGKLARDAGLRDRRLTFSYLVLRCQSIHDPRQIRVVSSLRPSKGKLEFFGCGESGLHRFVRLRRNATEQNLAVENIERGTMLTIENPIQKSGYLEIVKDSAVRCPIP